MKIYIAGKVTGEDPKSCKEKFLCAEFFLKKNGHTVVNPTRILSPTIAWNVAMRECISQLVRCDAIYMLDDWRLSKGAKIEHFIAKVIGLQIKYQNRADEYAESVSREISA